jgi:hypothetical protein
MVYNAGLFTTCEYPTLNLPDVEACAGNAVTLSATTTGTGIEYNWNNGATTPSVSLIAGANPSTQTLTLTINDNQGCEVSDAVNVIVNCSFATVGEPGSSTVSNMVYLDADSSFAYSTGDEPIEGAIVLIHSDGPDGISGTADDYDAVYITDANGHYEFNNLPPGEYTISVTAPTLSAISANGIPNTLGIISVTLGSGENSNPVFGFIKPNTTITLGVELMQWQALDNCGNISLSWRVGIEDNMSQYIVQHSTDGIHFANVGTVAASNMSSYSFTHYNPTQGNNYYRLLMQETNQSIALSAILSVESQCANDVSIVSIYPNPADNVVNFDVVTNLDKDVKLVFIDEIGRVVIAQDAALTKGKNTIQIETGILAKAVYYAGVLGDDGTFIGLTKVVITR